MPRSARSLRLTQRDRTAHSVPEVAISSGHMSATFAAAPRHLAVSLTSAQATFRLPASTSYAISSRVTAGYLQPGIPQLASAAHTIAVRIDSGELALLSG